MESFIRCLCEEDYTALIKSGKADKEQLKEAWIILLNEYHELQDSNSAQDHWTLSRDIRRLQNNLELTQTCIDFLNKQHSEIVVQNLRKLGYPTFKPTSTNPEDYRPLLAAVAAQARSKYIQLKQLIAELDKKNQQLQAGVKKPTREYFENLLTYIEEMQGTSYNLEEISTSRFIVLEKKYFAQLEAAEIQRQQAKT